MQFFWLRSFSLVKQCKKIRRYGKYFLFFHWQLVRLGGQWYWGQYECAAQLHYHCLISPIWFLPDFPTTLQLILPFGWAAHNPAISCFFAVLHALFFSINLCVIPSMSEIFLKNCTPVVHTFPLTLYWKFPLLCFSDWKFPLLWQRHFIFGIWGFSPQISVPWKWFYFGNRETEAHRLKLFAKDCTTCEQQDID